MDDLISRQAAIDTLERKKDKNAKGDIGGFYNKIIQNDIDALVQLPSAEQHGQWVETIAPELWECSVCGCVIYSETEIDRKIYHKWCGRCGTKMDGDAE